MKTLGYIDRCDGNRKLKVFNMSEFPKNKRIRHALLDLEGLGNVNIYLIKGNKARKISERSI